MNKNDYLEIQCDVTAAGAGRPDAPCTFYFFCIICNAETV